MKNCKHLLKLIQQIYTASLDDKCWGVVLEQLANYVNNGKTAITSRDNKDEYIQVKDPICTKTYGIEDSYIQQYMAGVVRQDIWTPIEINHEVGQICVFSDHMPFEELQQTQFYKSWLEPQGITDGIAIQLYKTKSFRIVLNVKYDDNTSAVKHLFADLEELIPHLCLAVEIWMKLLGFESHSPEKYREQYFKDKYGLTKTELKALPLYINTDKRKEMAELMGIEDRTAQSHISAILRKMNCSSEAEVRRKYIAFSNDGLDKII